MSFAILAIVRVSAGDKQMHFFPPRTIREGFLFFSNPCFVLFVVWMIQFSCFAFVLEKLLLFNIFFVRTFDLSPVFTFVLLKNNEKVAKITANFVECFFLFIYSF